MLFTLTKYELFTPFLTVTPKSEANTLAPTFLL